MDKLILLGGSSIGSRVAVTACPKCGRISRQILKKEYNNEVNCELVEPRECPVCEMEYSYCSAKNNDLWVKLFQKNKGRINDYNKEAKEKFLSGISVLDEIREEQLREKNEEIEVRITEKKSKKRDKVSGSFVVSDNEAMDEQNAQIKKATSTKKTVEREPVEDQNGSSVSDVSNKSDDAQSHEENSQFNRKFNSKVEEWKNNLLDTTRRNKMINYSGSRNTLRLVEPNLSELFNRLARDEELIFQTPINRDSDIKTWAIISLFKTLSYNLDFNDGDIKASGSSQNRDSALKALRRGAKLSVEEQGTNSLYLSFGFIEWKEPELYGSDYMASPVLLMPVTLNKGALNAPYSLLKYDSEIEVNPTLNHIFKEQYDFTLPPFEMKNEKSFEEYMNAVEEIVDKQGWRLRKEAYLGLLSFNKISMYHDLERNRARMYQNPVIRAIAGDPSMLPVIPSEYREFDFDAQHPEFWHQVVNSDSSQQEAILLSKAGISFVMEGPPGTGKSQTITNIIAEAIANGKRVLFVSEKAAALQVVLNRLTEVNLADFCLPLHNPKANKKEIVDNIGRNLYLKEKDLGGSIDVKLTTLFNSRKALNDYAKQLHEKISPLDESLYSAFGKISKLDQSTHIDYMLEDIEEISRTTYNDMESHVRSFERALRALGGKLDESPWHGTKVSSSNQTFQSEFARNCDCLDKDLHNLSNVIGQYNESLALGFNDSWSSICSIVSVLEDLIKTPCFTPILMEKEKRNLYRKVAQSAKQNSGEYISNRSQALTLLNDGAFEIDAAEWIKQTENAIRIVRATKVYDDISDSDLLRNCVDYIRQLNQLESAIKECARQYNNVAESLYFNEEQTLQSTKELTELCQLIVSDVLIRKEWFSSVINDSAQKMLEEIKEHQEECSKKKDIILQNWEPEALEIDADGMLARFKTEHTGLFKGLKGAYKDDMKVIRTLYKKVGVKVEDSQAIDLLQKVNDYNDEKAWFDENTARLTELYGEFYHGIDSDWNHISEGLEYANNVKKWYVQGIVPVEVINLVCNQEGTYSEKIKIAKYIEFNQTTPIDNCCQSLWEIGVGGRAEVDPLSINELYSELSVVQGGLSVLLSQIKAFDAVMKVPEHTGEYIELATSIIEISKRKADIEKFGPTYKKLFGSQYKGLETDWESILSDVEQVESFFAKHPEESLDQKLIASMADNHDRRLQVFAAYEKIQDALEVCAKKVNWFLNLFNDEEKADNWNLEYISKRYTGCVGAYMELDKWLDFVETKSACEQLGLGDFTRIITEQNNTVPDVTDAFVYGFYKQWVWFALHQKKKVNSFRKRVQNDRLQKFAQLDKEQLEFAKPRIRKSVINKYPNLNRVMGAKDELFVLKHEMQKKSRIMPLRMLFGKIPNLLLTLKPCLMMSPLSVAYFLDAEKIHFDMIIFDEASQIFPQDAIGAIARGSQVIITGDTNQLPPTNFFNATGSNITDGFNDEYTDEEVFESILEEASSVLPNRTLSWHYRSKHEHLIAFSNQEIYDNKLVTFPSSIEKENDLGVEFEFVEEGYYESGGKNHNIPEAKRCVELVRQHIEQHPERSLGIIAFGAKQQDTIIREIESFRDANRQYEFFFSEDRDEPFFVKNLENVQGDERDTIILSVCYAQTAYEKRVGKPMAMRFGPLGNAGGERRLNVAITRAKLNLKLVSSIKPADIDLNRTNSIAVKMLRSYIEFAMKGSIMLRGGSQSYALDDFVDRIAKFIEDHGYPVNKYVGCSGYKVDIAIKHPTIEDRYIAGIECDGYSYISAKTARDRDLLRVSVLQSMGWQMYRVWSTEWYNNPSVEGERLLAFIEQQKERAAREQEELERKKELEKQKVEEAKKAEEEKKQAERRKAEEERVRREAERRKAEEERIRKEAEIQKAEEERNRREAEQRKAAEEERQRRIAETERKRREVQQRAEEKKKKKAEEYRRLREERLRKEEEERRKRLGEDKAKGVQITMDFGRKPAQTINDKKKDIPLELNGILFDKPAKDSAADEPKDIPVPEKKEIKAVPDAKVGDKIGHSIFKEGTVSKVRDDGIIEVDFNGSIKRFRNPHSFENGFIWIIKEEQ